MEIKNVKVYGMEESLIRSGYPMTVGDPQDRDYNSHIITNHNDLKRGTKLGKVPSGTGHDNFLKGIIVQFDVKYPQYWTPQFQRYTFADIISSQSKMHKLTSVKNLEEQCNGYVLDPIIDLVSRLIEAYNDEEYDWSERLRFDLDNSGNHILINTRKDLFMLIISNLPMGYEMWMGITTNYLQLKTIYQQRKNHKLPEWKYFCTWVEGLPDFTLLTQEPEAKTYDKPAKLNV
jgi:hypothetical protein